MEMLGELGTDSSDEFPELSEDKGEELECAPRRMTRQLQLQPLHATLPAAPILFCHRANECGAMDCLLVLDGVRQGSSRLVCTHETVVTAPRWLAAPDRPGELAGLSLRGNSLATYCPVNGLQGGGRAVAYTDVHDPIRVYGYLYVLRSRI
jgi:hypothetical protein